MYNTYSCILFHFYIKPQLSGVALYFVQVVSYSISTSNHNFAHGLNDVVLVVSYSISTSNHNWGTAQKVRPTVVSYSISTSNHNAGSKLLAFVKLYLIPFLHQTTTLLCQKFTHVCCILFHFYIKPQRFASSMNLFLRCILFHFYIKPQLNARVRIFPSVVSYSISTSNHNNRAGRRSRRWVVSYSISTSNHNSPSILNPIFGLYLIPFLHQTTTLRFSTVPVNGCILFHFYIKPQLSEYGPSTFRGCILFHFYIKPQLKPQAKKNLIVVSYSISTSNHNLLMFNYNTRKVVSYSISTSNHNTYIFANSGLNVVSYSISTSNHNDTDLKKTQNAVVSYSISTSNHNTLTYNNEHAPLYLIPFLHQTTTLRNSYVKNLKLYLIPFLHQTTT